MIPKTLLPNKVYFLPHCSRPVSGPSCFPFIHAALSIGNWSFNQGLTVTFKCLVPSFACSALYPFALRKCGLMLATVLDISQFSVNTVSTSRTGIGLFSKAESEIVIFSSLPLPSYGTGVISLDQSPPNFLQWSSGFLISRVTSVATTEIDSMHFTILSEPTMVF